MSAGSAGSPASWREGSRLRLVDAVAAASVRIARRPGRSLLTGFGTLAGVAMVVATLGLTQTAARQVSARFDTLRATEVRLTPREAADVGNPFPGDTDRRLESLNGVVAAGQWWSVAPQASVATTLSEVGRDGAALFAASPGGLRAAGLGLLEGRLLDPLVLEGGDPVALVGSVLAERVGLGPLDDQPAVFVDGVPLTVVGVLDRAVRQPEVLTAVVIPLRTARRLFPEGVERAEVEVLIETAPGAAQLIGNQAPLALRPDTPEDVVALTPPDPRTLRRSVEGDLDQVVLVLGLVALVVGVVTIANSTLTAVLARTSELGIRRAVGARPRHLALHVLLESLLLGGLAGVAGAAVGMAAVAGTAIARGWSTVLDPVVPLSSPLVGALTGAVAGCYPAWRASRMDPIEALRR